jgi:hypothetical protein
MAYKTLKANISHTLQKAASDIMGGSHPAYINLDDGNQPSLTNTGAAIFFDQDHSASVTPDTRNIVSMSPDASILVKKKVFSSFGSINDTRYIDKTEKMLLRATKALFAYKVQQIRAYESLTKFENFFSKNQMYSLNLLSSLLKEGSFIDLSKLGKTKEEFVSERLKAWLGQDMSAVSFDTSTQNFEDFSNGNSSSASFDIPTRSFVTNADNRRTITNGEYLKNIPSSQARAILTNKRAEFGAEYDGVSAAPSAADSANDAFRASLSSNSGLSANSFEELFVDLGDLISYGSAAENHDQLNEDIASVLKRNAFSTDNQLTTWIVDPNSPENYTLGPGTGVIELAIFNSFNTNTNYDSNPSSASFNLAYPYRIGTILEKDIEDAVQEALYGSLGVLSELLSGGLGAGEASRDPSQLDASSAISSALEIGGAGFVDASLDTDYIRERLRTFYLGKNFINASDPVHFYIRGNRTFSDFTDSGSVYPEEASESPFDKEYLTIDDSILRAEYILYTNQKMSIEQYRDLRRRQDNSFGMVHVFGGFITSITENYSGGFHNLSVSCTDNMSWLKWSQFAVQPALSDPKGILEDPLTPYDFSRDEQGVVIPGTRELLYENKQLLQTGLLSYDSGLFAGQNASEGNLLQGQYNGIGSLRGKKVMQHPSGFIYRWKTGIITATAGFQAADSTGELQDNIYSSQRYQVTVTNNVLNNLDIPNILSILIVGQPYNIESFIEQALAAHNKLDKSTRLNPLDPLTGVLDTVRKQNNYYGNFQPYRMLTMNSASTEQMLNNASRRDVANNNIKSLQARKKLLRRKISDIEKSSGPTLQGGIFASTLSSEIQAIDEAIREQIKIGTTSTNALTSEEQIGIQISLSGAANLPISGDQEENNDVTRAMMLVGAQRKIEDVRLNRDRNLFMVSDQYDSADIRPFILSLNRSGWKLFDGLFKDSWQLCNEASNYLDLEFFCNSQGHLEFRPPLWNRVPLSILREAIRRQTNENKNIIPRFVTDLFQTRIEGIYLQVHALNIKIALIALLLGKYPDRNLIPNMSFGGASSLPFFGVHIHKDNSSYYNEPGPNEFKGGSSDVKNLSLFKTNHPISTRRPGDNGLDLSASFQQKGDVLGGNTDKLLGTFDPIVQEQMSLVNDSQTQVGGNSGYPAVHFSASDLNNIRNSFKKQFGRDPASGLIGSGDSFDDKHFSYFTNVTSEEGDPFFSEEDLLGKLKQAISNRDSFVSMLQANLVKQKELSEIETFLQTGEGSDIELDINDKVVDFLEKSANALQTGSDILTGKMSEGAVYDHLIEDDTRNLLGYGSGKRFILKDEFIISSTFSENPPEFTRLDISGNAPLIGDGLNRGFEGLYFWAGATDFDLWRQYGYKPAKQSIPFISDTEGQAKPYAILKLGMQKFAVNMGSVTISGNEFYQPGDTVFIPSKGLLYYVKSVSHTFSFGSSYTTKLDLEYGHPAGDYIPGPLDIIGQQMVSNFIEDPSLIYRSSETDDNYRPLSPDSAIVFPSSAVKPAKLLAFNDNQIRFTNMMLDLMGGLSGDRYVLIRGFALNEDDESGIEEAKKKMAAIRSLLESPSQVAQSNPFSGGDDLIPETRSLKPMRLPNSIPVSKIPAKKIIEQVSFFKKTDENSVGQIQCLDRTLLAAIKHDEQLDGLSEEQITGIFPKGGPSQGGWADIREEVTAFSFTKEYKASIVEVGIINIPSGMLDRKVV